MAENANLKHIVLIEDDHEVADYIRLTLENAGYKVSAFDDGQKGMDGIQKLTPDAVVTDIMLPRKNGYEICVAMQQDPKLTHIPIIVLTAILENGTSENQEEWRDKLQVAAFLTKPFTPEILLEKVHALFA